MIESHTAAPPQAAEKQTEQIRAARTLLRELYGAIRAATMYEANNRGYRDRAEALHRGLVEYIEQNGNFRIDYFNDFIFVDGIRLRYGDPEFLQDRELATLFGRLSLCRLGVVGVPAIEDLDRAIFALAHHDPQTEDPFDSLQSVWVELDVPMIVIGKVAPKIANRLSTDMEVLTGEHLRRHQAGRTFYRTVDLVEDFSNRMKNTKTFNSAKAQRVIHDLIDHMVRDELTLLEFAAMKDFDDYTYAHSTNVCIYSLGLGLRLGVDKRRLSQLGFAALFHDVGKIKLPQDLITKPDTYDEDDWQAMRRHPILGALSLAAMPSTDEHNSRSIIVAYEHHLGLDGSGYPAISISRDLNFFSRIVAIADSYDAMTSGRVYMKSRISPDEAIRRLLQQRGTRYDTLLLRAFIHLLGVFPVGTFVRLSTGEIAIVARNNPDDLFRPEVRVLSGVADADPERRMVSLSQQDPDGAEYAAFISEVVDPDEVDLPIGEALGLAGYTPGEHRVPGGLTID